VSDGELLSKSIEIAERLANGPIEGLKAIVKAHDNALSVSLNDQLDYERDTQEILLDKKEFKEGVSAFVGKRKPNFRDLS
jgi:2-(1,2-epoxy-1,2-dihydrophenyl)acetyl-CoA isomerase